MAHEECGRLAALRHRRRGDKVFFVCRVDVAIEHLDGWDPDSSFAYVVWWAGQVEPVVVGVRARFEEAEELSAASERRAEIDAFQLPGWLMGQLNTSGFAEE